MSEVKSAVPNKNGSGEVKVMERQKLSWAQLCLATSALGLVMGGVSAFAQEPQTGALGAGEDVAIEDVVVTAQRREETSQRAALSIDVISGEELREAGVTQPDDLTRLAPGLQVSGGTTTQVYVRGVGDFGVTATANPAVATSIDGVAVARPQAFSGNFFDLQRVELLRGPQGTLYGRNASGGALNLLTVAPILGENSGYAEVNIGDYDQLGIEGAFNIAAGENGAFRLSYSVNQRDGYLSDGGNDDNREALRLQGAYSSGALDLRGLVSYTHLGGNGTGLAVTPALSGLSPWTGNTDAAAGAAYIAAVTAQFNAALLGGCNPAPPPAGNCPPAPALIANPANSDLFQDVESISAQGQVDYDFGFATLTVIPAYRRTEARFGVQPSFYYNVGGVFGPNGEKSEGETSDQYTLEARLGGESDALKWVVGGYYFIEDQTNDFTLQGGSILNQRTIGELGTDAWAAFGQATYSVTERLRLTGGIRYTSDERTSDSLAKFAISPSITSPDPVISGLPPIPCLPNVPAPGANPPGTQCRLLNVDPNFYSSVVSFEEVTWKLGVELDLAPQSLLYFDVSTGFKAGGFNQALSLTDPSALQPYDPETITAYSIGVKNRFFDNRLQLNVEAFHWEYEDLQLSAQGLDAAGLIVLLTQNAGQATVDGANIDVVARPWRGGTLRGSVEWVDSSYDSFVVTQLARFVPPGRTGCLQTYAGGFATVDCSGFPLVRAPEWSGNVGFTQEFFLGNGGIVALNGDMTFSSSYYIATDFIPQQEADGYTNLSASLSYTAPEDRWFISAYARNITDEAIYTGGGGHQSGFVQGWVTSNIAPPRTYGVRLGVNF